MKSKCCSLKKKLNSGNFFREINIVFFSSFKGTRDLSLGVGAPAPATSGTPASGLGSSSSKSDSDKKKKFVPNLSVQRKENAGNSKSIITINKDNNSKPSSGGWKQQQQNSKFEKSRGGGRNFIQSSGLFSEGLGSEQDGKKKTWGRAPSGDQRDSKIMERPKMNLNAKYDKVEEEKKGITVNHFVLTRRLKRKQGISRNMFW